MPQTLIIFFQQRQCQKKRNTFAVKSYANDPTDFNCSAGVALIIPVDCAIGIAIHVKTILKTTWTRI